MAEKRAKKYAPSKLYMSFHVAGMRYHDGVEVVASLKPGSKLELIGEFDNPYDSCAIAIYSDDCKLGYIPSALNGSLAQLFYFGHNDIFTARVQQVRLDAEPHEQVLVGVYVRDVRKLDGDGAC